MAVGCDTLELVTVTSHDIQAQLAQKQTKSEINVLDLCCGSGAQGICYYKFLSGGGAVAKAAAKVNLTLVDCNPRALQLCELNLSLNGVLNASTVLSNFYANVGVAKFDRIITNPPFVATPTPITFSDGASADVAAAPLFAVAGNDGNDALRNILLPLNERLAEGGRLYMVTEVRITQPTICSFTVTRCVRRNTNI